MIKAEVIGADEFSKALTQLSDDIKRGILDSAFEHGAIPLLQAMKSNVRDSKSGVHYKGNAKGKGHGVREGHNAGNLRRSIQILPYSKKGGMYPTYWVKPVSGKGDPDGWYAKFVEYGHLTKIGGKGRIKISKATKRARRIKVDDHVKFVPARPFIRPAYDSHGGYASEIIKNEIFAEVEKYIKG